MNYKKILIFQIALINIVYETWKYKKSFIRTVKYDKNENHLNISIPRVLAERLQLTNKDYQKIYLDETNNLIFEKLEIWL